MTLRLHEFDILKGTGILLVMLGHTPIDGISKIFIYSFHLPLFFIVSGFFYKQQEILPYAKKLFKRLIIPWGFFALLFTLLSIVMSLMSNGISGNSILISLRSINPFDESCFQLYRTIWFLLCLFIGLNLYNILKSFLYSDLVLGTVFCFAI